MEIKDKIIKNGFLMLSHPLTNFEIQNIIKMSLDLMYLF